MPAQLAPSDEADFDRLEGVIRAGLQTFVDVGTALTEIKERGLYKEVCSTFEAYVQIRWKMSRARAYQLIDASETVGVLSTVVDTPLPTNEAQARPLAGLPDEQQREVWTAAVEEKGGAQPTAKDVKRGVSWMDRAAAKEKDAAVDAELAAAFILCAARGLREDEVL